jgi:hypothetical protein
MEIFKDDEGGYLRWVALNPGGFVLNCERRPSARHLVLHRAICDTICSEKRTNYTSKRQVVGLPLVVSTIPDLVVLD